MNQVIVKSIECKQFKILMLTVNSFFRVIVKDRTSLPMIDNCYTEFTRANFEFGKIAECFKKDQK